MSNLKDRGTLRGTLQRNSGNYNDLINKPAINGHTLIGNQSGHALGLANEDDIINVEANPLGEATTDLHKILIDDRIYAIPDVVVYGTASGAIASFDDGGDNKPLKSLKVAINPVQSGSGDPSPSNVRPIRGWDKTEIHRADGATPHIIDDTYNITWSEAGEVFGGELDVTSGVLRVDRKLVDLGSMTYAKSSTKTDCFASVGNVPEDLPLIPSTTTILKGICSQYKPTSVSAISSEDYVITYRENFSYNGIMIKDSTYHQYYADNDMQAFQQAMDGVQLVYELATPQEIQLTPTEVTTLLGNNNIWSDTGDILECVYQRDLNIAINKALS